MKFHVAIEIDEQRVRDLLTTALEGGSNYWYDNAREGKLAEGLTYNDFSDGGKMQKRDDYAHPLEIIPFTPGCSILLDEDGENGSEPKTHVLDRERLRRGLAVMADKYPKHLADFLEENDDATTGDVFLQCCLFGEVKYG